MCPSLHMPEKTDALSCTVNWPARDMQIFNGLQRLNATPYAGWVSAARSATTGSLTSIDIACCDSDSLRRKKDEFRSY